MFGNNYEREYGGYLIAWRWQIPGARITHEKVSTYRITNTNYYEIQTASFDAQWEWPTFSTVEAIIIVNNCWLPIQT
jgi:hypothetical protein